MLFSACCKAQCVNTTPAPLTFFYPYTSGSKGPAWGPIFEGLVADEGGMPPIAVLGTVGEVGAFAAGLQMARPFARLLRLQWLVPATQVGGLATQRREIALLWEGNKAPKVWLIFVHLPFFRFFDRPAGRLKLFFLVFLTARPSGQKGFLLF